MKKYSDTKKGENEVPVTHPNGLKKYFGEIPILPNILRAFNNANNTDFNEDQLWQHLNAVNEDNNITKKGKIKDTKMSILLVLLSKSFCNSKFKSRNM